MNVADAGVTDLVREYEVLVAEARTMDGAVDTSRLEGLLESDADWTSRGAEQLLSLAQQYGSFFLRNALALALALKVEDGDLGL